MIEIMVVSNVVLWIAVISLGVLTLALARQIGLLHERSAPLGAMVTDHGPEVGDEAPEFELDDFSGRSIQIGGERQGKADNLLVFLSPSCPMCNKLLPTCRDLAHKEKLDIVIISDGEEAEHRRFLEKHQIQNDLPYVVSAEIGMHFKVGRVPYAVLIDNKGFIRAKGLVNTREHLESLIEARDMNYASLQDYLEDAPPEEQTAVSEAAKQIH